LVRKVHFVAGLPRSGSTLLSALLRQNPRFHAAVTSPVAALVQALQQKMCGNSEFASFFDDRRRADLLRGLFDAYYGQDTSRQVHFDTNRTWTGKMALLEELFPDSRVICCVRDVGWIIDSIERMLNKNPLQYSRIFDFKPGSSVYARADILMNPDSGLIGHAWSTLREAWFGDLARRLIIVRYDQLAADPKRVLDGIYAELGEPPFAHQFTDIDYDEPAYDADLGLPGLHKVHSKVEPLKRPMGIPPDLFARYAESSFWARPEMNLRGVRVL
jgi:sulfotransferase